MKKISVLLILSIFLILMGYPAFREYRLINKGNKLSLAKEYLDGDIVFKEAINKYESIQGEVNSVVNLYNGKKYRKLLETTKGQEFLRGNSKVYIGEEEKDPQKQIESYEKALREYEIAMKTSSDINIKKNYEIISKRIEDIKDKQQKQEQNQNNEDQKDQEDKNKDNKEKQDKSQDNKSPNENNQEQDQNQEKQQQDNDKAKENKDQGKNKSNEDNDKDKMNREETKKSNQKQEGTPEEKDRDTQKKEALATLERLEDSEEQAFKNNERLQYLGGEKDSEKDTW